MRLLNTLKALYIGINSTKIFKPSKVLKNKSVVVIGAADSAFEEKNGNFINSFDYAIRINKAPHSLSAEKKPFIGYKTDILFHSFYENNESGGGPIDFNLYKQQGLKYLVNPNHSANGLRTHLTYFKRNLSNRVTYLLPRTFYKKMVKDFGSWIPTIGYSALYTVLNANCKEVYITGFTFFKTPYADDYRDHFKDIDVNNSFIEKQGIHNPDLELQEFITTLDKSNASKVRLDKALENIVKNYRMSKKTDKNAK